MIIKDETLRLIMACKLRDLRVENNLSQEDLASAVGLTRTSLCNLEAAEHGMTVTLLFKFCAVLQCDYADFFPTPDEHQPELFEIKAEKIRKLKKELAALKKQKK